MKRIFKDWLCGDCWLLLIIAAAALLGLAYNAVMMVGFGPDEPRHMAYVQLLFEEKSFPYLLPGGAEYRGAHTLHPPLYYFALLPFYAVARLLPADMTWHLVRLGSLVICLIALPLIYQIAMRVVPANRNVARLATAQVGLLPMFGMSAGTINNDSAAFLAVVVFLWLLCVKYPADRSQKAACVLGLCLGLGIMCKFNVLLSDGAAFIAYAACQGGFKSLREPRQWLRLVTVFGIGGLIALPWHLRNLAVYGAFAPIPPPMQSPTGGSFAMIFHPDIPRYLVTAIWGIFCTMWSQKDWIPEPVREAIYVVLAVYCVVAAIGFLRSVLAAKRAKQQLAGSEEHTSAVAGGPAVAGTLPLWCSGAAFFINWWAVLHGAMFLTWGWAEGGRYVLPSIAGFSLFVAYGWYGLTRGRLKTVLSAYVLAMLALNAVCICWLLAYLNPTFGPKG